MTDAEFLHEVEEELIHETQGDVMTTEEPQVHQQPGMVSIKALAAGIIALITILGGTYAGMNFLFVSQTELHVQELAYQQWRLQAKAAMDALDKDVQRLEDSLEEKQRIISILFRHQGAMKETLIKLSERARIQPPVLESRPVSATPAKPSYKSRLDKYFRQTAE